jgi:hypothetical protein
MTRRKPQPKPRPRPKPRKKPTPKPRTKVGRDLVRDREQRAARRRDPKRAAATSKVTPTKAGLRSLRRQMGDVNRLRKRKDLYSFRLEIDYNTTTGKRAHTETGEIGFPVAKAIRRRKGETAQAAFERTIGRDLSGVIHRQVNQAEGIVRYTATELAAIAAGSPVKIAKALRRFKARRGVKVRVVISHV